MGRRVEERDTGKRMPRAHAGPPGGAAARGAAHRAARDAAARAGSLHDTLTARLPPETVERRAGHEHED